MNPPASTASPSAPPAVLRAHRLRVAAAEYPRSMALGCVLVLGFTVLTPLALSVTKAPPLLPAQYSAYAVMVLTLGVLSLVLRTDVIPLAGRPWAVALGGVVLAGALAVNAAVAPSAHAYAMLLLFSCVCGPATLAWWPYALESAAVLGLGLWVLLETDIGPVTDWMLVTLGGVAVGGVLLAVRLSSIDQLGEASAENQRLAMTDRLTGLLNRHGLVEHAPLVWDAGDRAGEGTFAAFADIRGLKQANDLHGHEFGDRAIQAAARAVAKSVRPGDLVARWGGDEFVVVGRGGMDEAARFADRLSQQHEWTGRDERAWNGVLSVGLATAAPGDRRLDDLISAADADMYRRRRLD